MQIWETEIQVWEVEIQIWEVEIQIWEVEKKIWEEDIQIWKAEMQGWNTKKSFGRKGTLILLPSNFPPNVHLCPGLVYSSQLMMQGW